jgi:DNA-binding NarL/FixJ family response regulator
VSDAEQITVLVADDHAVVRAGIRHIVESMPGFIVVAEASDAAGAVRLATEHQPRVIVLDVSMPGGSGLSVLPELRRIAPSARILMLTMYDNMEYIAESMRAGAHGYLLKDSAVTDLRTAVDTILAGQQFFGTSEASSAASGAEPVRITARERQVLVRVAAGKTSREIATELGISPRTVETYRESLTRKLGITSVAGLTRYVIEHRIADEG